MISKVKAVNDVIIRRGDVIGEDNVFYLDKMEGTKRTRVHISDDEICEKVRLSYQLKNNIKLDDNYSVHDSGVRDRVEVFLL